MKSPRLFRLRGFSTGAALAGTAVLGPLIVSSSAFAQATFASLEQLDAAIFNSFDNDSNGSLSKAEIGGYKWFRYDKDNNGEVSRAEFDRGRAADRREVETTQNYAAAFRLLDWNDDGFLDGRETDNEKWLKYDSDKNGMVSAAEFVSGRLRDQTTAPTRPAPAPAAAGDDDDAPAPASRPAAKPVRAAKAKPAPVRVAPPAARTAAPVRLPPLKPRPGYVIGRAVFTDGRPIPSFVVSALGFYGKLHLGPTGTLPFLGEDKATGGRYAIQTRDYAYTKEPVDALVSAVQGRAMINYRGKKYALLLHPLDNKVNGSDPKGYRARSGLGAVRDFVLKMSGTRLGYESYNTPEVSYEDTGTMMNSFYGGTVNISTTYGSGGYLESKNPTGTVITLSFTPLGPLMDGSPSRTVTRSFRFDEKTAGTGFVIRNLPLCAYTASATFTPPDGGAPVPMKLRKSFSDPWQASQTVEFEPYYEYLGGVNRVDLTLTR